MYRLTDDIARRRMIYPPPIPGSAHIFLLDLPSALRGASLALGRYYPVVAETDAERKEFANFLAAPRLDRVPPDLLDWRASGVRTDAIIVTRYDPPASGWPWLSVCRWPATLASAVTGEEHAMARGCYTFDAFTNAPDLAAHQTSLLEAIVERHHNLDVRLIAADHLGRHGTA